MAKRVIRFEQDLGEVGRGSCDLCETVDNLRSCSTNQGSMRVCRFCYSDIKKNALASPLRRHKPRKSGTDAMLRRAEGAGFSNSK